MIRNTIRTKFAGLNSQHGRISSWWWSLLLKKRIYLRGVGLLKKQNINENIFSQKSKLKKEYTLSTRIWDKDTQSLQKKKVKTHGNSTALYIFPVEMWGWWFVQNSSNQSVSLRKWKPENLTPGEVRIKSPYPLSNLLKLLQPHYAWFLQ